MSDYEEVGTIGVDAGLCWIGDPCYVLHQEDSPKDLGKDWGAFCDKLGLRGQERTGAVQFHYDLGHAGLGVCVDTGWGDGVYPVCIRRTKSGRIAEVRVVFIEPGDEDEA